MSVHYRDNSYPVVHYQYPEENAARLSTWDAGEWKHLTFEAKGEPRGIEKLGPESFRIYATMGRGAVTFVTNDGGRSVKKEGEIVTPVSLSRCYWIENARPKLKLLMFSNPLPDAPKTLATANRDVYVAGINE